METDVLDYRMSRTVDLPYTDAVERTRQELAREGFGVLTEIDVRETLKKKLDVDFRRYIILGACNPPLAHRALSGEPDIGVLLPCNVVVYEADSPERTVVSAVDPQASLARVNNEALRPVATEVKARLERVLDRVAT
jgi:uncharacterized protein (DUF302 family)